MKAFKELTYEEKFIMRHGAIGKPSQPGKPNILPPWRRPTAGPFQPWAGTLIVTVGTGPVPAGRFHAYRFGCQPVGG